MLYHLNEPQILIFKFVYVYELEIYLKRVAQGSGDGIQAMVVQR